MCNCIQYNGNFSCWKFLQQGITVKKGAGHCHVFPFQADGPKHPYRSKVSILRDSRKALDLQDELKRDYLVNGVKGPKFNIADGVAIDYMHCVLINVQKTLLQLWFCVTHKEKPFNFYQKVCKVDERLKT